MSSRLRPPLALTIALALVVGSACSGDDDTAAPTTTLPEVDLIAAADAGEGDTRGHDLARGDATPRDAQGRHTLHHGDEGPDVEALQRRLVELGAPIAKPDGLLGDQTMVAVMAFQRAEGLTPDGVVGQGTWAALDAPKAAITWTLPDIPTAHTTDGPAATTGAPTGAPSTTAPAARGDATGVPVPQAPAGDPAARSGAAWARAVITLGDQTATFYDAAGNIVFQVPISSGKNGLTPTGTFHVQSKSQRAFAGNGVYMDWMTRFSGGVGFHSIPKRASGEDLPTPLGQRPVSHGCIRMADQNAKLVFERLPIGATVEVHP